MQVLELYYFSMVNEFTIDKINGNCFGSINIYLKFASYKNES